VINGLDSYQHHVIVLHGPDDLRKKISRDHSFLNLELVSKMDFLGAISKVRKYVRQNKIDIIHGHLYQANILSRLSAPKNVKLFNTIHAISSLAAYKGSKLSLIIEKATYKKRTHIIGVSKEVVLDFDKYVGIKGESTVLYNFVEEVFFASAPKSEFSTTGLKLVAVGNLREQKNYPYIIEAFKNMDPSVTLDVYGEGSMRKALQEQIDHYKLNIRLCGLNSSMHKVLPQYDAFLMSSFYEGQPLSLLEAMASGLPAILSDIPVLREVANENAVYFDIQDPGSLSFKINEILSNKELLTTLAAYSHKRVNEFAHAGQYFKKLKELYQET
jgi:glycosyltransferase involved in cell wall biosynthesis